jgi:hypothetical protein
MEVIKRDSFLWSYLTPDIRGLIEDGEVVLDFVDRYEESYQSADYSFLVFSFAKAYEGFLKKFFLDLGLIKKHDYFSDDIRIGRILNPGYVHENVNVFNKVCDNTPEGRNVSKQLWQTWKRGRNMVFHYFPHNFKKLTYAEAYQIVEEIINAMQMAVTHCRA